MNRGGSAASSYASSSNNNNNHKAAAGAAPYRRQRVYQQWQGNERFFCWGFCVAGPSWRSCFGSLALVLAPTAIFLAFVAWYMGARISMAIFAVSCVLPALSVAWLLTTACRDPGILPRQEPDDEWLAGRKPRTKDVAVNGHRVQVRYNDTCHFYQPPRAHHCSVNDNCIERFDHHCPWVGTTIGQRNYRTFLLFIYTTTLYLCWTFAISLWMLFVKKDELVAAAAAAGQPTGNVWMQVPGQCGPAIALIAYSFLFLWFVGGLSGFHTYLVAVNQTTYENFRYHHSATPNPYNLGLLRNCASIWCTRVPPSKVDFRAFVGEPRGSKLELAAASAPAAPPAAAAPPPPPPPREALPPALAAAAQGPLHAHAPAQRANGRASPQPPHVAVVDAEAPPLRAEHVELELVGDAAKDAAWTAAPG